MRVFAGERIAAGCFLLAVVVQAATLSEQDAVRLALERNTTAKVARIDRTVDSLSLRAAESAFLPQAELNAELSVTPAREGEVTGKISASASQAVPGGGSVSGSAAHSETRNISTENSSHTSQWSLTVRQPLAAGAWRYGQPGYSILVQRLSDRESEMRFRQRLAAIISDVRGKYWNCYQRMRSRAIAAESMAQAERLLAKERTRFAVGDAAVIDTLGAALEYLKAEQAFLSAEAALAKARRELATALMLPTDSVVIPESLEIVVSDLPPAEEFLAAVRQFDPQRSLFELAYDKLQLQLGQRRNALLPQVDLVASYRASDPAPNGYSLSENSVFSLIAAYALPTRQKRIEAEKTRLAMEQSRTQADRYERELHDRVTELIENWSVERRKMAAARVAAEVARKKLEVAEKSYEIGASDQLSYLQARKDAFEALMGELEQSIGLKRLEIVFDELTGAVLTRCGVLIR